MYTEEDIAAAVAHGILGSDAAAALREHTAARRQMPLADEEHFRLVTSFNDVFVVIASLLLLLAVGAVGTMLLPWSSGLLVALAAWGLSEVFTRQRRMALPSIVLMLVFVAGLAVLGMQVGWLFQKADGYQLYPYMASVLASLLGTLAAYVHWRRFRVPLAVAVACGSALAGLVCLLLLVLPSANAWIKEIALLGGVMVFALAMWWDSRDRQRLTWRADVAFWLHLLAAPLLVHPVFMSLVTERLRVGLAQAMLVLLLYLLLAVVSLCIDRRALMVSALAYVLCAFVSALDGYHHGSYGLILTGLLLGGLLLLLSVFWPSCRALVLCLLPDAVRSRLPPLASTSA